MTQKTPFYAPIRIIGTGKTAQLTALALADAGFVPNHRINAPSRQKPPKHAQGGVLALSPATRALLARLQIWQKLSQETSPVQGMDIYAPHGGHLPLGTDDAPLAYIVNESDLAHAIAQQFSTSPKSTSPKSKPPKSKNTPTKRPILTIATESSHNAKEPTRLAHDYQADALTTTLDCARPHQNRAYQIFLPEGALACLPLAQPHRRALIWSLPRAQARALARLPTPQFLAYLNAHSGGHAGTISACSARHTHPLHLHLSTPTQETTHAPHSTAIGIAIGAAAHQIHPLAGQGFNLSVRDIAALVKTLHKTRRLGLDMTAADIVQDFARRRHTDAAAHALLTHGLNALFADARGGYIGAIGLDALARLGARLPSLPARLIAGANHGL